MPDTKSQTSFSGSGLGAEIKKMVGESLQGSANTFMRSLNLLKTVATQKSRQNMGALDIAKCWAQINLETSRIISRHTQEAASEILDTLEQYGVIDAGQQQTPRTENRQKPRENVVIKLNSKRGGKASALFVVSNPGPRPMAATFDLSEFTNEEQHVVKNVAATFSPAVLELPPDSETAVEVAIDVSKQFRVDKCYKAAIGIPEYAGKEILIELRIDRVKRAKATTSKKKKA